MSTENTDQNREAISTGENEGRSSVNHENSTSASLEEIGLPEDGKNAGAGPVDINDGGVPGEAKQPKEHTGYMTEMGGDAETAATRIPDDSEGNSNGLEGSKE
ncbi:hypothetical protein [Aridibaculum aurantiacum]|uniref:hypothetical protein n=1 Tax=Aridibaculum aurantiacum TaxID=2810307 RepID=UPI001A96DDCF|nr:hypothetical protein [Aridibaculum aurantiacum]